MEMRTTPGDFFDPAHTPVKKEKRNRETANVQEDDEWYMFYIFYHICIYTSSEGGRRRRRERPQAREGVREIGGGAWCVWVWVWVWVGSMGRYWVDGFVWDGSRWVQSPPSQRGSRITATCAAAQPLGDCECVIRPAGHQGARRCCNRFRRLFSTFDHRRRCSTLLCWAPSSWAIAYR